MTENKPNFHGSDIEAASAFYHIPKDDIICFSSNVNPLGLSMHLKEKLSHNLDILSSYPDRNYESLKEALATYCKTSPEYFVVGNGSTELISVFIQTRRPSHALIVAPTYSEYSRELSLINCTLDEYYLPENRDFRMDLEDFHNVVKNGHYPLVILCNPNNPTASALDLMELRELLSFCKDEGTFVMIDETYVEFTPNPSEFSAMALLNEFDNFIVLRGVSKFYAAPGMRFGYGATSNKELHQAFLHLQNPWSLNSLAAYAGEIMFSDQEYISNTHQFIQEERKRMLDILNTRPGFKAYPSYANFILVKLTKEGITSQSVFDSLMKQGLMIRDCSSFEGLEGEFIRFCIMNKDDNTRLLDALSKFC